MSKLALAQEWPRSAKDVVIAGGGQEIGATANCQLGTANWELRTGACVCDCDLDCWTGTGTNVFLNETKLEF